MSSWPMIGPRRAIGRHIAGETVTRIEVLTDESPWIIAYVEDREIVSSWRVILFGEIVNFVAEQIGLDDWPLGKVRG